MRKREGGKGREEKGGRKREEGKGRKEKGGSE